MDLDFPRHCPRLGYFSDFARGQRPVMAKIPLTPSRHDSQQVTRWRLGRFWPWNHTSSCTVTRIATVAGLTVALLVPRQDIYIATDTNGENGQLSSSSALFSGFKNPRHMHCDGKPSCFLSHCVLLTPSAFSFTHAGRAMSSFHHLHKQQHGDQ
jgi:hypothetical protein